MFTLAYTYFHTLNFTLVYRPSEVHCVSGKPHLLVTPPPKREPFYQNKHEVVSPKIRSGDGGGTIVYSNLPSKQKFVSIYMQFH